jgi:hypothetical protein
MPRLNRVHQAFFMRRNGSPQTEQFMEFRDELPAGSGKVRYGPEFAFLASPDDT